MSILHVLRINSDICIHIQYIHVDTKEQKKKMNISFFILQAPRSEYVKNITQKIAKMENISIVCYSNGDLQRVVTNFDDALRLIAVAPQLLNSTIRNGVAKYMELTPLSYFPTCESLDNHESFYYDIFLDSFAAMLTDLDEALKLLRGCIAKFSLPSSQGKLKSQVKTILESLRITQYRLKAELSKSDMKYGLIPFQKITDIYSQRSDEFWNYKYWLNKVFSACIAMKDANIPLEMDITAKFHRKTSLCISHNRQPCKWS